MLKNALENRRLVWNLAKDDFKKKFAGSNLGIVWAFIQPVITVLLYWFVFEKGLRAEASNLRTGIKVPFVLWLMAGLVPWFYLQESWNGATGSLIEYSYLVKKVVFQIDILPIVKMTSALFVHLFFVGFTVILAWFLGSPPSLYTLQVIYYSFAMICFLLGLSYATSAVVLFFRDLNQIVSIVIQIGTWATPIMWNIESIGNMPEWAILLLKLNPMYYVVAGYRDALIHSVGFWEHPYLTVWFWAVTAVCYLFGTHVFRKLKPLFADVL